MPPNEHKPPLRFRRLRIAWSVFWGIACVLLIALWVRSYVYCDDLRGPISKSKFMLVASLAGGIQVRWEDGKPNPRLYYPSRWEHTVGSVADFNKSLDEHRDMEATTAKLVKSVVPHDRSRINMTMRIGWYRDRNTIFVPYWLSVLLTGVLAVAIGMSRSYRFSFSLRTLLITTTLMALALGLIMWLSRSLWQAHLCAVESRHAK